MRRELRSHGVAGAGLLRVLLATRPLGARRPAAFALGLALVLHGGLAVGLMLADSADRRH